MAKIQMVRIDSRLIHGQVITKWLRQTNANRIVIINDALANDDFMKDIYEMAAPSNISVDIYSIDYAANYWKENEMGEGNLFILFKDIKTVYEVIEKGLPINEIQIGGLGSGPEKTFVFGPIAFDDEDYNMLDDLQKKDCYIYLHQVPEEPKMELKKAFEKYKSATSKKL